MLKITCRIKPDPAKEHIRLDHAIASCEEVLRHDLSRGMVRKLIIAGAVYVNGRRVQIAGRLVHGSDVIDLYWDQNRDQKQHIETPLRVLYEDEAIICFDKPAGLPAQPTLDEARLNLFELAKRQLSHQKKKAVYLGLHHRLDRDTTGVMLFTLDKKYNAFIADLFKSHKISKLYVAVVHGCVKQPEGKLESFLDQVGRRGKQARFGSVQSGGKKAITNYSVLASNKDFSLVQVNIETGRTHQIRVHFSEMKHPIVGDTLYGSPASFFEKTRRHLLHAHVMTFEHPLTHGLVRVESPVPPEFRAWVSSHPISAIHR